ncbi:MAG: spermidine synthase, partial [Tepidisphaeraceae bacterium]
FQAVTVLNARSLAGLALAVVPALMCFAMRRRPLRFGLMLGAVFAGASVVRVGTGHVLLARRTFFGTHQVVRTDNPAFNDLYHGTTLHGRQSLDRNSGRPSRSTEPLTYYHRRGPIGRVIQMLIERAANAPPTFGFVGLGSGSLAAYASAGATITFFEIDPQVVDIADRSGHFSYTSDARSRGARIEFIVGDARLTLARTSDKYDLIVLDAFSGDAIPVHLLTRQAMEMYSRHIEEHGLLAIHISNAYLDLHDVVAALARDAGWFCVRCDDMNVTAEDEAAGRLKSQWVVFARSSDDFGALLGDPNWTVVRNGSTPVWTDDFSNIVSTLKRQ